MDVNWNDARLRKSFFMLLKISVKFLKRNWKKQSIQVEKIKKLADFGDFVREKTDSLYSDYLKTRLMPLYEKDAESKSASRGNA